VCFGVGAAEQPLPVQPQQAPVLAQVRVRGQGPAQRPLGWPGLRWARVRLLVAGVPAFFFTLLSCLREGSRGLPPTTNRLEQLTQLLGGIGAVLAVCQFHKAGLTDHRLHFGRRFQGHFIFG